MKLERFLITQRTPGYNRYACGGNDRVLAFVAVTPTTSATRSSHLAAELAAKTLGIVLANTSDDADEIDMTIRRFEQPFSPHFSQARIPALLQAAHARLVSEYAPDELAFESVSAVVLTTQFGDATIASVGECVDLVRIRSGKATQLTRPTTSVSVYEQPTKPGDIYVLGPPASAIPSVVETLANTTDFDRALAHCMRAASPVHPVLIGRCPTTDELAREGRALGH
jgi:hypothetical protein